MLNSMIFLIYGSQNVKQSKIIQRDLSDYNTAIGRDTYKNMSSLILLFFLYRAPPASLKILFDDFIKLVNLHVMLSIKRGMCVLHLFGSGRDSLGLKWGYEGDKIGQGRHIA